MEHKSLDDIYQLDELIGKLEDIHSGIDSALNIPKAIYSLAIEIRKIKQQISEESSTS